MAKRIALFPASFDPITNGHLDIIQRVLNTGLFDELVLAVGVNPEKKALFTLEERFALLKEVVSEFDLDGRIRIEVLDGLMVEHARRIGATVIVRGIRSPRDFEYEAEMNFLNHHLAPEIETLFLITHPRYASLSSTLVKQVAEMGGNLEGLVPPAVIRELRKRIRPTATQKGLD